MVNKIKFSVSSYEGDSEYSMLPKEALAKIRQLEAEEEKWAFIGGNHVKAEFLTEKDLVAATEKQDMIVLVNAIAGGNMDKIVEIDLTTSKKSKGIKISLDVNEYRKKIDIVVGEDNLIDILHDRENLYRALKLKLDALAEKQIEDLMTALNVE